MLEVRSGLCDVQLREIMWIVGIILPLVLHAQPTTPKRPRAERPKPLLTYESYLRLNGRHPALLALRNLPQEAFKEATRSAIIPTQTGADEPSVPQTLQAPIEPTLTPPATPADPTVAPKAEPNP